MASAAQAVPEIPDKSLFTIAEVARLTSTKPFVLRYWESEFPMLEPVKSRKLNANAAAAKTSHNRHE